MRDLRPRPERVSEPQKPKRKYVRKDSSGSTKETTTTGKKGKGRSAKKHQGLASIVGRGTPSEISEGREEGEGSWRSKVTIRTMQLEDIVEREESQPHIMEEDDNINMDSILTPITEVSSLTIPQLI